VPFDPTIAAIRFGMGLSPTIAPPASVDDMLTRLAGSDEIGQAIPIPTFSTARPSPEDFGIATRARNAARGTDAEAAAEDVRDALRADSREAVAEHMKASIARAVYTHDGFRERLALFWADHFTVRATAAILRHLVSPYIEEAIRPHVARRFADMLVAVVGSPMMIVYLDQNRSMGPNSRSALRRDGGLNENLAREVLELHTLGVGGAYTQDDVRQFAELLTGVTANAQRGGFFQENRAEPGSETVLGVTYGGDEDSLDHVNAALRDIAMHPDTARHLAQKLAVHFIGPYPENALVVAMAARYLATDGTLFAMYEVLLADEAACCRKKGQATVRIYCVFHARTWCPTGGYSGRVAATGAPLGAAPARCHGANLAKPSGAGRLAGRRRKLDYTTGNGGAYNVVNASAAGNAGNAAGPA
jgi:hypothetical protein